MSAELKHYLNFSVCCFRL